MASIEKRTRGGKTVYLVRWRGPNGGQRSKQFATKRDARIHLTGVTSDIQTGVYVDPRAGRVTVAEWWDEWWPSNVHLARNSRDRDERSFKNHVKPAFGNMKLDRVERSAVREWITTLSESGLAPETVQKIHQTLRKLLQAAVEDGKLRVNPADHLPLPRIVRKEPRALTVEQIGTLAKTIDQQYRPFVLVGAYCGLRIGELAGLAWRRIDLRGGTLDVAQQVIDVAGVVEVTPRLKSKAAYRRVPVPAFVCKALSETRGNASDDDLVITDARGGPLRTSNFRRRIWNPGCTAAGLDGLDVHELRHSAVSLWIAHGGTPVEVARWAGHSSVATVFNLYGHLFPSHGPEVAAQLDAIGRTA